MKATRREFIRSSAAVGIGFLGLYRFSVAKTLTTSAQVGYGPLTTDPKGIFNLPKGFSYHVISRQGSTMNDGLLVPGKGDGMAAFKGNNNRTILIRNHENVPGDLKNGPFGKKNELLQSIDKRNFYDYGSGVTPCIGGTTTLVYNHGTKKVEKEFLALSVQSELCRWTNALGLMDHIRDLLKEHMET
jgi:secreted PhoX family phosphatase